MRHKFKFVGTTQASSKELAVDNYRREEAEHLDASKYMTAPRAKKNHGKNGSPNTPYRDTIYQAGTEPATPSTASEPVPTDRSKPKAVDDGAESPSVDQPDDAELYLQAMEELDNDTPSKALWAKVITLCEGDKEKARYRYIKTRVDELKRAAFEKEEMEAEAEATARAWEKAEAEMKANRAKVEAEAEAETERAKAEVQQWEQWEEGFMRLAVFVKEKGHARIDGDFITWDGFKLGHWVSTQRQNKHELSPERISRLEALVLGWRWNG